MNEFFSMVVCVTAKIHFLKQFTTWKDTVRLVVGCLCYCKDTLFEAIHNMTSYDHWNNGVVCVTAKIHFLKQFTTNLRNVYDEVKLFVLLQRYTF